MKKASKTYTPEFKREAMRLAQTSGKPIVQVARELGISGTSIHQWRKELSEHGPEAFPGSGHQTAQEEELRQLRCELERTHQEHDILKKAEGHLLAQLARLMRELELVARRPRHRTIMTRSNSRTFVFHCATHPLFR